MPLSLMCTNRLSAYRRQSHFPTDIDIHSISLHAQAKALVQRVQQSILDMDGVLPVIEPSITSG